MAPDKPVAPGSGKIAGPEVGAPSDPRPSTGPPSRRSWLALLLLVLVVTGAAGWWRDHQALALGPDLAAQARPGDIHMLSSLTCIYCQRARQWLTVQRVPFDECFIETDDRCAAQYQALMAPGTPLLLVRGQAQSGFSPQQVFEGLQASAPKRP